MKEKDIMNLAAQVEDWMTAIRRQLHQNPELGFEEEQTQALICAKLEELGVAYQTQRTWVVGLIQGDQPGGTVALRADMDALPLTEMTHLPFGSRTPGKMHACGHDAHVAILLGAAKVLSEHRGELAGNVKLLFQPAEETVGGAKPMVEAGCLENPHVDWAFGLHVMPHLPVGTVETRFGALNASTDDLKVTLYGKSGHGAHPEGGADAIVCAAQLITALQSLVSRSIAPTQAAAVHFGMIQGGSAPNVLCDKVCLTGTLRTVSPPVRARLKRRLREMCAGVCQAMGCTCEVDIVPDYAALINHPQETKLVLDTAAALLGETHVLEAESPSMGAEDFSYFIEHTPGAFFHLGCADPAHMPAPPLHSRGFMLDERCMALGAAMEVALVNRLIGKER